TGVQTCALPIFQVRLRLGDEAAGELGDLAAVEAFRALETVVGAKPGLAAASAQSGAELMGAVAAAPGVGARRPSIGLVAAGEDLDDPTDGVRPVQRRTRSADDLAPEVG